MHFFSAISTFFGTLASSAKTLDVSIIVIYIFGLILIILLVWIVRVELKLRHLLIGKNATSLEDSLVNISKDIKEFKQFTREMQQYLTTVEMRLKKSVQGVETVRYNPFKGTGSGGNNSFSTAFLNEKGDGVVLTSMYARDRISMFGKPVKDFVSDYELSEEEQEAITQCKQKLIP